jgi:hypothetical protein
MRRSWYWRPTRQISQRSSGVQTAGRVLDIANAKGEADCTRDELIARLAEGKGCRLEKVGKGAHHGRFSIFKVSEGARISSGIVGDEFSFSLEEAAAWLTKAKP